MITCNHLDNKIFLEEAKMKNYFNRISTIKGGYWVAAANNEVREYLIKNNLPIRENIFKAADGTECRQFILYDGEF